MSGLADYQRALATAACQGTLSGAEAAMLQGSSATGIAMTARVRSSWCAGRARRAAPLTLSALAKADRERIVLEWVAAGGGVSSFFEAEADAFLAFIVERLKAPSHAASLCRFERAVIRARAAGWDGRPMPPCATAMVSRSPDADLIELHAPLDVLLDALAGTRAWPDLDETSHSLLVAPGITGLVREASAAEIALWQAAETEVQSKEHPAVARVLVACGALLSHDPPDERLARTLAEDRRLSGHETRETAVRQPDLDDHVVAIDLLPDHLAMRMEPSERGTIALRH